MKPITSKVEEKLFLVGELRLSEQGLLKILGEPHYIETDSLRTCGGPQWFWGFFDDDGSIIVIDFHPLYERIKVGTNQPDSVEKLLAHLKIPHEALSKYDGVFDYHG